MNGEDHAAHLEGAALLAVGALPEAQARVAESRLAACDRCGEAYHDFVHAAELVGVAAEWEAAHDDAAIARVRRRLFERIGGEEPATAQPPPPPEPVRTHAQEGRHNLNTAFAATACAAIFIAAFSLAALRHQYALVVERDRALTLLSAPQSREFALSIGAIVENEGHVYLVLHGLPRIADGHVFEAWTIPPHARAPHRNRTFVSKDAVTIVELDGNHPAGTTVALTIEPRGGRFAPSTRPLFTRTLE